MNEQPQGQDVMKELGATLMQSAEADSQIAQVLEQSGGKQAAELLKQASMLKMKALQAMGISSGEGMEEEQEMAAGTPEAGGRNVKPATVAGV